jgi:hypothetical protein
MTSRKRFAWSFSTRLCISLGCDNAGANAVFTFAPAFEFVAARIRFRRTGGLKSILPEQFVFRTLDGIGDFVLLLAETDVGETFAQGYERVGQFGIFQGLQIERAGDISSARNKRRAD